MVCSAVRMEEFWSQRLQGAATRCRQDTPKNRGNREKQGLTAGTRDTRFLESSLWQLPGFFNEMTWIDRGTHSCAFRSHDSGVLISEQEHLSSSEMFVWQISASSPASLLALAMIGHFHRRLQPNDRMSTVYIPFAFLVASNILNT